MESSNDVVYDREITIVMGAVMPPCTETNKVYIKE